MAMLSASNVSASCLIPRRAAQQSPVYRSGAPPRNVAMRAGGEASRSWSEDDLDRKLAEELRRRADPNKAVRDAKHLELLWAISKTPRSQKPEPCEDCHQTAEKECSWCHGTGVLTVGDTIFCSVSTHSCSCPVCKGTGYVKCESCRGTGFKARWMSLTQPHN